MKFLRVLFQGDSITDVGRNREESLRELSSLGFGYPGKVAGMLQIAHPEIEWEFIDRGISGDRVVDLYQRWKKDCLNLRPDVLSILIGINDTWHEYANHNGVEVPRYERIYRELLQWTKDTLPDIRLVLLEPFLLPAPDKLDWCDEVRQRQDIVRKLAKEFEATFISLQKPLDELSLKMDWQKISADGVHPTYAGHQFIANLWCDAVKF